MMKMSSHPEATSEEEDVTKWRSQQEEEDTAVEVDEEELQEKELSLKVNQAMMINPEHSEDIEAAEVE